MIAQPLGVGCPMWANRDWVGSYLPSDTPVGRELEAYARVCNAVEGNTTFYATPDAGTVARWREATPAGFRFVFKLPQEITHDRRLRGAGDLLASFAERIEPLAERLGPLLVQLPASFGPDALGVLDSFLATRPSAFAWAVEVRHAAFHPGGADEHPLNELLHRHGVDRVILDSRPLFDGPCDTPEEHDAFDKKPRLPVRAVATAAQPIVRFVGQTVAAANRPYWQPWIDRVGRWIADGRRPIVFLHTPDNAAAPGLCREFHAAVVATRADVPSLPAAPPVGEQQAMPLT